MCICIYIYICIVIYLIVYILCGALDLLRSQTSDTIRKTSQHRNNK